MNRMKFLLLILLLVLPAAAQDEDGALLLYTTGDAGGLSVRALNADTGEETAIAWIDQVEGAYGRSNAGWSPDGRYVWVVDVPNEDRRRLHLYRFPDWSETTITEDLLNYGCDASLYWSPDGATLAYLTGTEQDLGLSLLNVATDTTYTFDKAQMYPVWSADSHYLAIGTNIVDASDGTLVASLGYVAIVSPDSRYVGSMDGRMNWSLYELATGEVWELEAEDGIESWSPDGRYLVFRRRIDDQHSEYLSYDIQTDTLIPIDTADPVWRIAGWMADSDLLIVTQNADEQQALLRYAIPSGVATSVIEGQEFIGTMQSDGRWLAVSHTEGDTGPGRILLTDGEGTIDREVSLSGQYFADFISPMVWSPDHRRLAITGSDGMYVFDRSTHKLERLPVDAFDYQTPGWSADGRYLAFRVYPEDFNHADLMLWHAEDGTVEQVPYAVGQIIGWQGGASQKNLQYCGEG